MQYNLMQPMTTAIACLLFLLGSTCNAEIRVEVDTGARTLSVMDNRNVIAIFNDISIGRFGKTYFKQKGDGKTPLGRFRVGWFKKDSQFYRFLGLDYPDLETASRALVDEKISESQWQAIRRAEKQGKTPPQNTPLGGLVGIHGIGEGDIEIHRTYNWTNGCIAVTNEQMDRLLGLIKVGTWVDIR